ncbi:LOW QUALITY PROTEIN: hypothetical protein ACHAW6_015085, partial [Cyclotella cf. meneghiniana]
PSATFKPLVSVEAFLHKLALEVPPLPEDTNKEPASGSFNYADIVGLLYLTVHLCSDIALLVSQCVCYTFHTTWCHDLVLL